MLSSHLTSATEARKMAVSPLRRSQRGSVAASLSKSPSHVARMDSRSPYIFPLKIITFMGTFLDTSGEPSIMQNEKWLASHQGSCLLAVVRLITWLHSGWQATLKKPDQSISNMSNCALLAYRPRDHIAFALFYIQLLKSFAVHFTF